MAIIYSYPTVAPTRTDLILGTDVSVKGKPTKNFTVQSIIDLVTVATGDLQTVLDLGFVAVGKDIDLTNNTFKGAGFQTQDTQTPANILVNITGQVGTGFTDFTSTRITGTLQTPSQTNITSLGILTDLKVGNANNIINKIVGDTAALNGPMASPGLNTNLVTEKAIVKYITSQPFPENLFKTLQSGNKAYDSSLDGNPGFNIDMGVTGTTNGNILFGDNKGIKMGDFGVTYPFRIGYGFDSSTTNAAYIENATVTRKLAIESDILDLTSFTGTANYLTATKYTAINDPGVLLYYNNVKTFETILGGATVTGNLNVTLLATTGNIDNNGYYQDSSNSKGTDGQVLTSTGTGTGTAWVDQLVNYTWKLQTPLAGSTPITIPTNTTVKFLNGNNISIQLGALAGSPPEIGLTFNATGLVKNLGTGVDTRVTYWTGTDTVGGSGTFRWVGGSGLATSGLSVDTQIRSAKFVGASGSPLTNTTATWEGSVMSGLTSVATVNNATANNPNGFFGPLRQNASSTNYAPGVADKAVQLTVQGDISTVDDVISYPTTSGTVEAQGAVSKTVVFETSVGKNLSIIYPVQGQVVSGTGITVGTKVASISGATMVLDTITSATLVAGASLSFAASVLDIYTSGGNVRMPSFIPSTVATGKYLTGFSTPAAIAGLVNANDSIIIGIEKLQTQITALLPGLDYLGTWDARNSISTGLTAAAETSVNTVVLTVPNFNILIGTVIDSFAAGGNRTVTAVSADFLSITFGGAAQSWVAGRSLVFYSPSSAGLDGRGGNPNLISGTFSTGQYYVVNVAGTATPNGTGTLPNEWKSGDWAIYGDATLGALRWQKLDNTSSIEGNGATNKIAKWTGISTLGTGLIADDASVVTIGATGTGNFLVEGTTTLGGGATNNTLISGDLRVNKELNLVQGLGAFDGTNFIYGPAVGGIKPVLTSGGSATTPPTWAIPTVGTVTSVGLTETGNALTITNSPITTSGDINIAGAGAADQYINGQLNLVDFPDLDNYVSWTLAGDTGTSQTISSTNTATFAGGFGISTVASATDTLTTAIDITGTDNAIAGLTAATPLATDTLWFNDISDSNTIRKSTLANLPFQPTLSGTQYTIPMFATASTLGNSMITQNAGGTAATISGTLTTTGSLTSTLGTFSDKVIISASQNPVLTLRRTNGNPSIAFGGITGNTAAGEIQVIGSGSSFGSYTFYSQSGTLASPNYLRNMSLKVDSAVDTVLEIGKGSGNKGTIACEGSIIVDIDKGNSATGKFFLIGTHISGGSGTELLKVKDDGIVQMPDYGSGTNTGTPTFALEVDSSGNIIETPSQNTGGGGTFNGDQTITNSSPAQKAFTLNRATTGTLIFDVWFTSETSTTTSVAKKYTVAHANNATPVYNKIIDTGPHAATARDFTVSFVNAGSGLSVECYILGVGIASQNIGYTVQVGYDSTNALTFTAAS